MIDITKMEDEDRANVYNKEDKADKMNFELLMVQN